MTTDTDLGNALLATARGAIGERFGVAAEQPAHRALAAPGATFVTLRREGALRGCIGSLEPRRPLGVDVHANAIAAAFADPRFPPLAGREFAAIDIEVSLLAPSEPFLCSDEAEALARLRPEVDGVILEYGWQRATFLPQVWEQLPDPRAFLAALKRKAGLPAEFWDSRLRLSRYTVTKFEERAATTAGDLP
jgi:AmmeMemoRadiSam system protein A